MIFRAIQPNPSYDMLLMSSQRNFKPKKKQEACRPDTPPFKISFLAPEKWPKMKLSQIGASLSIAKNHLSSL